MTKDVITKLTNDLSLKVLEGDLTIIEALRKAYSEGYYEGNRDNRW